MIRLGTAVLLGGLFMAAPLQAQSTGHQHGGHQPGTQQQAAHQHGEGDKEHCAMHNDAVHRHAPKMLLKHEAMLQLTAVQKERLQALHAAHETDCHARMERAKAAEQAAAAALELAAPDVRTFEAKSREAANLKIDCKVDMVKKGQEAVALLTPAQRAHLAHMGHTGH